MQGRSRSFGQLLILNAGGGYYMLLAGMQRIDVQLNQFVLAGEPVAVMGETSEAAATIVGSGTGQPVLYIEFRKDGVRSIRHRGGRNRLAKRFADDAPGFSRFRRRSARRRSHRHGDADPSADLDQRGRGLAEVYRSLNLFGDIFEKIRTDYVEKPDEQKLIEAAINGMVSSLDPHSAYLDAKSFRDMDTDMRGQFGGLGIEVTMEEGVLKVAKPIRGHARLQGRHPGQRHHHADRRNRGEGAQPPAGGREDARTHQHAGEAQGRARRQEKSRWSSR